MTDNIIVYYENGGPAAPPYNTSDDTSKHLTQKEIDALKKLAKKYKDAAKSYKDTLHKTYYKDKHMRGVDALYGLLKMNAPDTDADTHPKPYPPKRFVKEWAATQFVGQINRQKRGVSKPIQSIITSRPNELLQIDYLYFFRNIAPEVVEDEDDMDDKEAVKKVKDTDKLFEKEGIRWRGAITAIDGFSRYAYVYPIEGVLNSTKARKALHSILKQAVKRYKVPVKSIYTDKGPEFTGRFRDYLVKLNMYPDKLSESISDLMSRNDKDPGKDYKHFFSFEGRSHAQGIVERFNGTYKRSLLKMLGNELVTSKWHDNYQTALDNYNDTPHTTISSKVDLKESSQKDKKQKADGNLLKNFNQSTLTKVVLRSPAMVSLTEGAKQNNWKDVKRAITAHAVKNDSAGRIAFKVGDYVRIRIFKPKKDKPNFSYRRGPLWELLKKEEDNDYADFAGVYVVSRVFSGKRGNVAKAPTYEIIAPWSKEKTPGMLPSSQTNTSTVEVRTLNLPDHVLDKKVLPNNSYARKFVKEDLIRVPTDKDGYPLANFEGIDDLEAYIGPDFLDVQEYTPEAITAERKLKGKKKEVLVSWEGYESDDDTWEPQPQKGSGIMFTLYQKFLKSKK
eukprot:COSAG06_NODE_2243_length_7267_cov_3.942662_2_plen_618_part_00